LKQAVFFTPQYPEEPARGMGYVVINREIAREIAIQPEYQPISYGGHTYIDSPRGRFRAYCDNPYSYGGRNKRRFKVHSHGKVIELVTQKKLTIDAVLYFVRSWADKDAKVITPGKRTICLDKQKAKTPCYVYFILNSSDRHIKIGVAKNVKRRLASLQTSNSAELVLLKSVKTAIVQAAQKLERSLHQKFAKLRGRGEWFESEIELLDFIDLDLDLRDLV